MPGTAAHLPPMASLVTAYPHDGGPDVVKKLIGGHVNADWILDTCAIRMSRALNYSNFPIPGPGHSPMKVVSGADGKWYALNHAQLRDWIHQMVGPPQIHQKKPNVDQGPLKALTGLIALDIRYSPRPGETLAATGHIDLWGGQFIGEYSQAGTEDDDFAMATDVQLWVVPAR
jgi:hypothetical protein